MTLWSYDLAIFQCHSHSEWRSNRKMFSLEKSQVVVSEWNVRRTLHCSFVVMCESAINLWRQNDDFIAIILHDYEKKYRGHSRKYKFYKKVIVLWDPTIKERSSNYHQLIMIKWKNSLFIAFINSFLVFHCYYNQHLILVIRVLINWKLSSSIKFDLFIFCNPSSTNSHLI